MRYQATFYGEKLTKICGMRFSHCSYGGIERSGPIVSEVPPYLIGTNFELISHKKQY